MKWALAQAERYHDEMPSGVFSLGRHGSYRYAIDIDDCIEQAMAMAEQVRGGGQEHPVPGPRVGLLRRGGDTARREPRPQGHAQGAQGGGASAALLAALPAPHVREPAASAG
jgi:hypothetical protein